jgi:hypothetical protein
MNIQKILKSPAKVSKINNSLATNKPDKIYSILMGLFFTYNHTLLLLQVPDCMNIQ